MLCTVFTQRELSSSEQMIGIHNTCSCQTWMSLRVGSGGITFTDIKT